MLMEALQDAYLDRVGYHILALCLKWDRVRARSAWVQIKTRIPISMAWSIIYV